YRVAVALLNHLLIAFAVCGVVLWVRCRGPLGRLNRILFGVYVAAAFAVYATSATETRFGLPLMLAAPPLAAFGWSWWRRLPRSRALGCATAIAIYIVLALAASDWMRAQCPAIWSWKILGRNLALFQPARQVSTLGAYGPENGVDGVRTGIHAEPGRFNGFHTDFANDPWWEVDLGAVHRLTVARIYNAAPYQRAAGLRILLSDDDRSWRLAYDNQGRPFTTEPLVAPLGDARARFLRLQLPGATWLHLEEVEIYGF
ncbi:MAG TPA: discoidin domain-containing protein, partial [Bryobacteraceae bacterium]|nr:discoidin domain-containing protein [Bryobacteraceae bacterium]